MERFVLKLFFLIFYLVTAVAFSAVESTANSSESETKSRSPSMRAEAQPETKPVKGKGIIDTFVDNITGTIDLTSNYVFRGLTQTENLPAVQGGFTYTTPIGLYATVWASNNKFIGTDINLEVDPGIGFYKEIKEDVNLDIAFYRYFFPSDKIWNYNEWIGQFNFKFLQFNFGYSDNVYNVNRTGVYYDGGINFTVPAKYLFNIEGINILALAGRYELPKDFPDEAGISYNNYTVVLSKDFKHYNLALQYSNTSERAFYLWYGGDKLVCTLTASF
ncbi:bacterial protein of unknown function [Legionella gratiana]|uniref:Bacterial protein of uncharacterized function (Gcw_chp) n=1 Tax=Legionella gratiana TaxID=45066 RepID=A0A378JEP5_9GAMM|nr:TorF family putative porin [Legionella gratiana]KTD06546.1 bacterial protein of unknown function [Legionella gratiana]STX45367.1 Bacterial protein of uncharacterised function (Gcw_chp) [Legionella gratiana]